ncbi:MAG: thiamine diphosphokinase [bacterium]
MLRDSVTFLYDALVVAHGDSPSRACLLALAAASRRVVALDGAANRLLAIGVQPHFILGDLDSISPQALKSASRHRTRIVRLKEQETSDLEKGLRFCVKRGWKQIAFVGFLGPRLDHSLNAFGAFSKFRDLEITLITSQSIGHLLHGRMTLTCRVRPGLRISLMPLPVAKGVTLSGVRWPLRGRTLRQGDSVSLSNEAIEPIVRLRQGSGSSVVITDRRPKQVALECEIRHGNRL